MRVSACWCSRGLLAVLAIAGALSWPGTAIFGQTDARGFVRVRPDQLKWVDEPDGLGVKIAVVYGDRSKPGIYVIRVHFPKGVMSNNHFHREDRHAVVLQGTWWTGTGQQFTPDNTVGLKAGSYMMHPAGEAHFDGAKDEDAILQLIGNGPSETTRIRPQEPMYRRSVK